jgi:outer membrane protein OmpA-like peptidoglycan-associated protein
MFFSNGVLSGTPLETGSFDFSVSVDGESDEISGQSQSRQAAPAHASRNYHFEIRDKKSRDYPTVYGNSLELQLGGGNGRGITSGDGEHAYGYVDLQKVWTRDPSSCSSHYAYTNDAVLAESVPAGSNFDNPYKVSLHGGFCIQADIYMKAVAPGHSVTANNAKLSFIFEDPSSDAKKPSATDVYAFTEKNNPVTPAAPFQFTSSDGTACNAGNTSIASTIVQSSVNCLLGTLKLTNTTPKSNKRDSEDNRSTYQPVKVLSITLPVASVEGSTSYNKIRVRVQLTSQSREQNDTSDGHDKGKGSSLRVAPSTPLSSLATSPSQPAANVGTQSKTPVVKPSVAAPSHSKSHDSYRHEQDDENSGFCSTDDSESPATPGITPSHKSHSEEDCSEHATDTNNVALFYVGDYSGNLHYRVSGVGGHLSGETDQSGEAGTTASPVTALADSCYAFDYWLNSVTPGKTTDNPRVADKIPSVETTYTAYFKYVGPCGGGGGGYVPPEPPKELPKELPPVTPNEPVVTPPPYTKVDACATANFCTKVLTKDAEAKFEMVLGNQARFVASGGVAMYPGGLPDGYILAFPNTVIPEFKGKALFQPTSNNKGVIVTSDSGWTGFLHIKGVMVPDKKTALRTAYGALKIAPTSTAANAVTKPSAAPAMTSGFGGVIFTMDIQIFPDPSPKGIFSNTADGKTLVKWDVSPTPTVVGYKAYYNRTLVCKVINPTCTINKLVGPNSLLTVVAIGESGTRSVDMKPTFTGGKVFSLALTVHFDTSKYVLKPADIKALDALVKYIKLEGFTQVSVAGHADIRSHQVNLVLSKNRAAVVIAYLTPKLPGVKFFATAFADEKAASNGKGNLSLALNRRSEIFVR